MLADQSSNQSYAASESDPEAAGVSFAFGAFELDLDDDAESRWTPEFKALFGLSADADLPLDGGGLPMGIHPDDRASVHAQVWAATDPAGPGALGGELRVVRPGGVMGRLLLLGHVFSGEDGRRRLSGVGLDLGAHQAVQEAHARLLREQAFLADFSLRARDATDIQTICDVAATVLVKSMEVIVSRLFELRPDGRTFLFLAGAGWRPPPGESIYVPPGPSTPAGLALQLQEPVILNEIRSDPRFNLPAYLREAGVAHSMAVVIQTGTTPFGVLEVGATAGRPFKEGDLQFLQSVTNVLATTIVRIHSEERWRQEDAFTTVALNASTTLVTVVDAAGRLVRFSPACERLSGYSAVEALGRPADEMVVPEEREEVRRAVAELRRGPAPMVHTHENHWLTRSGERRLITWSATVLRDRAGKVQYVVGTGLDITDRKRLERDILAIAERERRRIGNDLHDDLGQRLAAIQFLSRDLQEDLAGAPAAVAQLAGRISTMAREANSHARMLARGLSPAALEAIGLAAALRALARNTTALFRVACECQAEGDCDSLAPEAAIHLYRIAQEAVGNAVNHALAKQIVIEAFPQGRCELRVTDDGIGFNPEVSRGEGIGLQSMQYRASLFRGRVHIDSQPGQGTRVICEFPPTCCRPDSTETFCVGPP